MRKALITTILIALVLYGCGGGGDSGGGDSSGQANSPLSIPMAWMNGSTLVHSPANYGVLGLSDPSNTPGARQGNFTWSDNLGNLWLFGGVRYNSTFVNEYLNDLWKYDVTTQEWTWMNGSALADQPGSYGVQGISSASNHPGARTGNVSWRDSNGNFLMFGGFGYDSTGTSGYLNDLWRYELNTGEWTWIGGSHLANASGVYGTKHVADSANTPGGRGASAYWPGQSGDLWLFGGFSYDSLGTPGQINDLWRYEVSTGKWTWMDGSDLINQPASYGTLGIADSTNIPGPRTSTTCWVDTLGNFWLFGGNGFDSVGSGGFLNDLWRYEVSTGEWTWMKGSNLADQLGSYGIKGLSNPANSPGARWGNISWVDGNGDLWLWGGYYEALNPPPIFYEFYSDFWRFDVSSGDWVWEYGFDAPDQSGVYGTQGVADDSNFIGGRYGNYVWNTMGGGLWVFGGAGLDENGSAGHLNDLWWIDVP